jgi:hypothetical protein
VPDEVEANVKVTDTTIRYSVEVDPPANSRKDDPVVIDLEDALGQGVPRCRLALRRTNRKIAAGLLARRGGTAALGAETIAAPRSMGFKTGDVPDAGYDTPEQSPQALSPRAENPGDLATFERIPTNPFLSSIMHLRRIRGPFLSCVLTKSEFRRSL